MTTAGTPWEIRQGAREITFRVDGVTADRRGDRVRALLSPDPYAGGQNADEYTTSTLYFDTADHAVYRRRGSCRRSRHRVRRYGTGNVAFLERKLRYCERSFSSSRTDDWEKELMAFYNTDVEVPATLVVDGRTYRNVGLHFRGVSSFMGVPEQ
jgi:hypothetical protein